VSTEQNCRKQLTKMPEISIIATESKHICEETMEIEWLDIIMIKNFLYAIAGVLVGVISSVLTYKLINWVTRFDIPIELEKGNLAVGVVVSGIFIMIGLIVGLIIGMSLN